MCQMQLRGVGGLADYIKLMCLKRYMSQCCWIQACAHLTKSSVVHGTQWFRQAWERWWQEECRRRRQKVKTRRVGGFKEGTRSAHPVPTPWLLRWHPWSQAAEHIWVHWHSLGLIPLTLSTGCWSSPSGSVRFSVVSFPINVAIQREARERHVAVNLLFLFCSPFQQSNLKRDTDVCTFSLFSHFILPSRESGRLTG